MSRVDLKVLTGRRGAFLALLAFVLIAGLAFMPLGHASAQSNGVTWKNYDVTIDVQQSGTFHVTERQVVQFDGRFSTGFATIPLANLGSIENVKVSLGNTATSMPI